MRATVADQSGGVVPPVLWLVAFLAGVFVLLALVLRWAGGHVPNV